MDKAAVLEIANKYISYLKNNEYDIVKAYLFGSFAKGNYNTDSDIDLAVIFNNLDDEFKMQVNLLMLTINFDTRIEPHPFKLNDFNRANPLFYEIMKNGIELM
jgi:uncharacterized protein